MRAIWNRVRRLLIGRRFGRSVKRSNRAADVLDAALREVLKR